MLLPHNLLWGPQPVNKDGSVQYWECIWYLLSYKEQKSLLLTCKHYAKFLRLSNTYEHNQLIGMNNYFKLKKSQSFMRPRLPIVTVVNGKITAIENCLWCVELAEHLLTPLAPPLAIFGYAPRHENYVSIGYDCNIDGGSSLGTGNNISIIGSNSIAIGRDVLINESNSSGIGSNITIEKCNISYTTVIGSRNKIMCSDAAKASYMSIIGSDNEIYINEHVVCENIAITGSFLKVYFDGPMKFYKNVSIIDNHKILSVNENGKCTAY